MTLFEKIAQKKEPAEILYEDDYAMAILDIEPKTKGHTLIIPKKARLYWHELEPNEMASIALFLMSRSVELRKTYANIRIVSNTGNDIMDIPHLHLHMYGIEPK